MPERQTVIDGTDRGKPTLAYLDSEYYNNRDISNKFIFVSVEILSDKFVLLFLCFIVIISIKVLKLLLK